MTGRRGSAAPAAALVVAAMVVAAAPPGARAQSDPAEPVDIENAPISSYGYGDAPLRGLFGRADLFFPLPPGTRATGGASLLVELSHSPLLRPSSSLTVTAGDVSLASVALTGENANRGRLPVTVPPELIGENGLAVSVRSYMRLTDDDCEEPANPALWATVHRSSTVAFATEPAPRTLDDAATLVVGPDGRRTVRLGLPGNPSGDDLRAAGVVAAQIGRWQAARHADAQVALAGADPTLAPTVVVAAGAGTPAGFPVTWTGAGYRSGDAPVSGDAGLLALAQTGPPALLVAGSTPSAAARAAEYLGARLSGPVQSLDAAPAAAPHPEAEPWRRGAASFAQLGIDRRDLHGMGAREVTVPVDRPPGWAIEGDPHLDLVVEAAAGLDGERSTVQALVAGIDLGSHRLRPGGGPRTYRFEIPVGLADRRLDGRPLRTLDLTLRFHLDVPRGLCEPFDADGARVSVLPTSAFRLPHHDGSRQELGRFPYPLADGRSSRIAIVLPDGPDRPMVAAGVQLAAAVGRWLPPSAPPPLLTTAGDLDPRDALDHGLILLGDAHARLGGRPDLGLRGPDAMPATAQVGALIALVPSPVDDDRAALVIDGEGPGALLAARTLSSRTLLEELDGSAAMVRGELAPVAVADAPGGSPPPELAPVVGGRSFVEERSWLIPAVVLLAGFLAALVLVARARWGRRARHRRGVPAPDSS